MHFSGLLFTILAEIIKKQNGHNDKENSQNGNLESEHDISMNSPASDSTSKVSIAFFK